MNQASYDLDRLRVNGLITRIAGRNFYRLTGDGLWFAIFYTKVHDRLLRPLLAAAVGSCRGGWRRAGKIDKTRLPRLTRPRRVARACQSRWSDVHPDRCLTGTVTLSSSRQLGESVSEH